MAPRIEDDLEIARIPRGPPAFCLQRMLSRCMGSWTSTLLTDTTARRLGHRDRRIVDIIIADCGTHRYNEIEWNARCPYWCPPWSKSPIGGYPTHYSDSSYLDCGIQNDKAAWNVHPLYIHHIYHLYSFDIVQWILDLRLGVREAVRQRDGRQDAFKASSNHLTDLNEIADRRDHKLGSFCFCHLKFVKQSLFRLVIHNAVLSALFDSTHEFLIC